MMLKIGISQIHVSEISTAYLLVTVKTSSLAPPARTQSMVKLVTINFTAEMAETRFMAAPIQIFSMVTMEMITYLVTTEMTS